MLAIFVVFFFFQAEDGIRDGHVTGVQTCALPIFDVGPEVTGERRGHDLEVAGSHEAAVTGTDQVRPVPEVRERCPSEARLALQVVVRANEARRAAVAPAAITSRSSTRTRAPRRAKWKARLAPCTPAPTMMT